MPSETTITPSSPTDTGGFTPSIIFTLCKHSGSIFLPGNLLIPSLEFGQNLLLFLREGHGSHQLFTVPVPSVSLSNWCSRSLRLASWVMAIYDVAPSECLVLRKNMGKICEFARFFVIIKDPKWHCFRYPFFVGPLSFCTVSCKCEISIWSLFFHQHNPRVDPFVKKQRFLSVG